jgi:inositol monophosphatase 3
VDAYVHTTRIKKWDICAGNAILNAADGRMTVLSGHTIDYGDANMPQNDEGLLATLFRHETFLKVFSESGSRATD